MSSTEGHSRRVAIEEDAIGARRVRVDRGANVVGRREGVRRRTEAVHDDQPPHELGERARQSDRLAGAERVRDHANSSPDDVAYEQREVEVQQRPREARVERPAVAVTAKVERDRVITERRDAWREVVEHAAVVVGAVEQQHRCRRRVTPAPEPQLGPIDVDELRAIRLTESAFGVVGAHREISRWRRGRFDRGSRAWPAAPSRGRSGTGPCTRL